jgi:hypothetical protein
MSEKCAKVNTWAVNGYKNKVNKVLGMVVVCMMLLR